MLLYDFGHVQRGGFTRTKVNVARCVLCAPRAQETHFPSN